MKTRLTILCLCFLVACKKETTEKPIPIADTFGQTLSYQTRQPITGITTGGTTLIDKEKKPLPIENGQLKNIILLVFNGATVSETNFNYNGDIACEASGLTISEQQTILDSVQKDFKYQYNKITTDSNLYNQSQADRRVKIIITTTYDFSQPAGGASYPNSFTWGNNTPGFVFSGLLNYNLKIIRVAVSHEIGHTYGLRHTLEAGGEIMNGQGSAYYTAWIYWGTGHNEYGSLQYDGRIMESVNGGKWDGQYNFKPYGTY
jgi:hypothetical protein